MTALKCVDPTLLLDFFFSFFAIARVHLMPQRLHIDFGPVGPALHKGVVVVPHEIQDLTGCDSFIFVFFSESMYYLNDSNKKNVM